MRDFLVAELGRTASAAGETTKTTRRDARVAGLARILIAIATASACSGKANDASPSGGAAGASAPSSGGVLGGSSGSVSSGGAAAGDAGGAASAFGGSLAMGGSSAVASGGSLVAQGGSSAAAGSSATAGGALPDAGGAGGIDGGAGGAGGSDRVTQVSATPAWAQLKALWAKLDQVLPKTTGQRPYASTITTEQREQLLQELESAYGALEATQLLTDLELLFLREVITARVEVMRDGGYHYELYLHRAPTPFESATENSLDRLEQKIDVLEALRTTCSIEAQAYQEALTQVEREATVFFVMDQMMLATLSAGYLKITLPQDVWGEELFVRIDALLSEVALDPTITQTQKQAVLASQSRLAEIKSTALALPALLAELERCDG